MNVIPDRSSTTHALLGDRQFRFDSAANENFCRESACFAIRGRGELAAEFVEFRHLVGPVPQQPQNGRHPGVILWRFRLAWAAAAGRPPRKVPARKTESRSDIARPDRDDFPRSRLASISRKNASQNGRDRRSDNRATSRHQLRRPSPPVLGPALRGPRVRPPGTPGNSGAESRSGPRLPIARMPASSRMRSRNARAVAAQAGTRRNLRQALAASAAILQGGGRPILLLVHPPCHSRQHRLGRLRIVGLQLRA